MGHVAEVPMENTSTLVTKSTVSFVGQVPMAHVRGVRMGITNMVTVETSVSTADQLRRDLALGVLTEIMKNDSTRLGGHALPLAVSKQTRI